MTGGWHRVSRVVGKVLARVAVAVGAVVLVLGVAEAVFRWPRPFTEPRWPSVFDSRVGFRFEPGSTVRWTNEVDYWTETKANALGFLDREPPSSRPADGCRVLFIGDSFVEAAQVPMDKKFHVLFERLARERLGRSFQTVAFGYSGTGQANQLPFYEVFGRDLKPDVVVLVFTNNDLANNSPVLEAVRAGWHPDRAPRLFFRRDQATGRVRRMPIDAEWQQHVLTIPATSVPERGWITAMHERLFPASVLYRWAFTHLSIQLPALTAKVIPADGLSRLQAMRMAAIRDIPGFADVFDGWNYPDDLDYDLMFFAKDLPPVFEEAVTLTGHVVQEYLALARRDGFTLAALAAYGLHQDFGGARVMFGREMDGDAYFRRVAALLRPRDVPVIDQHDYIVRHGGRAADAHFRRDGHWSEQGHRWAAEALLEFFEGRPDLCRTTRS